MTTINKNKNVLIQVQLDLFNTKSFLKRYWQRKKPHHDMVCSTVSLIHTKRGRSQVYIWLDAHSHFKQHCSSTWHYPQRQELSNLVILIVFWDPIHAFIFCGSVCNYERRVLVQNDREEGTVVCQSRLLPLYDHCRSLVIFWLARPLKHKTQSL